MSLTYIKSDYISVFPCAYRNPIYKKARFTTEENLTNLTNISDNKNNYLYAYMLNSTDILIYIDGYRFVTTLDDLKDAVKITDLRSKTIYAGIKYNYSEDIGRCLSIVGDDFEIPQSSDINDALEVGVTELDQVKVSQHTILDAGIDPDNLYFGGIAFTIDSADRSKFNRYIALNFDGSGKLSNKILTIDTSNIRNTADSGTAESIDEHFSTKKLSINNIADISDVDNTLAITYKNKKILTIPGALDLSTPNVRHLWMKEYYSESKSLKDIWVAEKDLRPNVIQNTQGQIVFNIADADISKQSWGLNAKHSSFFNVLERYIQPFLELSTINGTTPGALEADNRCGTIPIALNIIANKNYQYNTYKGIVPIGLIGVSSGIVSYQYVAYKLAENSYVKAAKCDLKLTKKLNLNASLDVEADGVYTTSFYIIDPTVSIDRATLWSSWTFNGSIIFDLTKSSSFATISAQTCLTDLALCFASSDIDVKFKSKNNSSIELSDIKYMKVSDYITKYGTIDNYKAYKNLQEVVNATLRNTNYTYYNHYIESTGKTEAAYLKLSCNSKNLKGILAGSSRSIEFYMYDKIHQVSINPDTAHLQLKTNASGDATLSYYDVADVSETNKLSNLASKPSFHIKYFQFSKSILMDHIQNNIDDYVYRWAIEGNESDRKLDTSTGAYYYAYTFDSTIQIDKLAKLIKDPLIFIIDKDGLASSNINLTSSMFKMNLAALNISAQESFDTYNTGWVATIDRELDDILIDKEELDDSSNFDIFKYAIGLPANSTQFFTLANFSSCIENGLPYYEFKEEDVTDNIHNPNIMPGSAHFNSDENNELYAFCTENASGKITHKTFGRIELELLDPYRGNIWTRTYYVYEGSDTCIKDDGEFTHHIYPVNIERETAWMCGGGYLQIPTGWYLSSPDYARDAEYAANPSGPMYKYKSQRMLEALIRTTQRSIINISIAGAGPKDNTGAEANSFNNDCFIRCHIQSGDKQDRFYDVHIRRWSNGILTINESGAGTLEITSTLTSGTSNLDGKYEHIIFNFNTHQNKLVWYLADAVDRNQLEGGLDYANIVGPGRYRDTEYGAKDVNGHKDRDSSGNWVKIK